MSIRSVSTRKISTSSAISASYGSMAISSVVVTDSSYNNTDDQAVLSTGGYIKILGVGFLPGYSLYLNGIAIASSTYQSPSEIRAVTPSVGNGTYNLTLFNTNGTGAIYALAFSGVPTWTADSYTNQSATVNVQLSATGDAPLTFELQNGSTLPPDLTLSSTGLISGTLVGVTTPTVYTFTVLVNDPQLQTAQQLITLTVAFGDPNFKNVTLLLNGETNVTPFNKDASSNSFALTVNGEARQDTFSPYYGNGYYSYNLDGGSYILGTMSPGITIGTSDFCLEGWGYWTSFNFGQYGAPLLSMLGATAGELMIRANKTSANSTSANFFSILGASTYIPSAMFSSGVSVGTLYLFRWHHLAVQRISGTWYFYVDGAMLSSTSAGDASLSLAFTNFYIGSDAAGGGGYMAGNASNIRLVVGSAPYSTSGFTVPTAPLTNITNTKFLSAQSNKFLEVSGTGTTTFTSASLTPRVSALIPFEGNSSYTTYGSMYGWDQGATSDYLTIPHTTALDLSSGDFTIEAWVYRIEVTSNLGNIISKDGRPSVSYNSYQFVLSFGSFYALTFKTGNGNSTATPQSIVSTVALPSGQWVHAAVVKSGTTITIYQNGVNVVSATQTTAIVDGGQPVYIGMDQGQSGNSNWSGYISDLRVIKGTALYTANFTPPTAPITAVANTQLLSLQYNGATSNTVITDDSAFGHTVVRTGNVTPGTFSPYSQTGWSNYFDGSTYFYGPAAMSTTAGMGTGFSGNIITIETWIYPTTISGGNVYSAIIGAYAAVGANGRYWFGFSNTGNLTFTYTISTGAEDNIFASGNGLTANEWHHIAVTIDATTNTNSTVNMFLDGTRIVNATGKNFTTQTAYYDRPSIGGNYSQYVNNFTGYLSNFRITKGTAIYTNSYTPSKVPLSATTSTVLLTFQNNRVIDNSISQHALALNAGTTSIQSFGPFGGTTTTPLSYSYTVNIGNSDGYVTTSAGSAVVIGTNQFTIEAWVFITPWVGGGATIVQKRAYNSTGTGTWSMVAEANGSLVFYELQGPTTLISSAAGAIVSNTLYHVAVSRDATNTLRMFINGVSVATPVVSAFNFSDAANTVFIGRNNDGAAYKLIGNISNLRIVIGSAVYTSAFTPSTTPLTAIPNTALLTCQSNTISDNSGNNVGLSLGGTAFRIQTFNPFGQTSSTAVSYTPALNGGSLFFDGTGDYLDVTANNVFASGTSNLSISTWIYPTATGAGTIYSSSTGAVNTAIVYLLRTASNFINVFGFGGSLNITGVILAPTNAWTHVTVTRNGNVWTLFVNGAYDGTATFAGNSTYTNPRIGWNTGSYFTGYISDLQFIPGGVLYGGNFYPPLTPATRRTTYPAALLLSGTSGGLIDYHGNSNFETIGNTQNSTSIKKYGSASIAFDGTGDSLKVLDSPTINLGSGDFTLEFWVYFNAVNAQMTIISKGWNSSSAYASYLIWMNSDATIRFLASSTGSSWDIANDKVFGTMTAGVWTHIAVTRSGTSFRAFVNGVINDTFTFTSSSSLASIAAQTLFIGDRTNGGTSLNGYLDDVRITKGFARYTATFTPPTQLTTQ